jgi:hypothetical protein
MLVIPQVAVQLAAAVEGLNLLQIISWIVSQKILNLLRIIIAAWIDGGGDSNGDDKKCLHDDDHPINSLTGTTGI